MQSSFPHVGSALRTIPSSVCHCLLAASALLILISPALSQPALTPTPAASDLLGPPFESRTAGISLRPPAAAGKIIRRAVSPDEIVQFVSDEMSWQLNVSRLTFRQGVELTTTKDAANQDHPGLLELTCNQFKTDHLDSQILRQDVTTAGGADVGMLAMRYSLGNQRRLLQQALIQSSNQLYYLLTFTSPGAAPDQAADPREEQAVAVFRKVVDSVKLLDRGAVRQEQDQRLLHSRLFYLNLNEARLRKSLLPQQYLRLIRDGKDIGYTCVFEDVDSTPAHPGVRITTHSHTAPDAGLQVDIDSWLTFAFDRRHEQWSSAATIDTGKAQKESITETGVFDRLATRVIDPPDAKADPDAAKTARFADTYTLSVTTVTGANKGQPMTQPVPPFYLPQALGHLLPRLLPLKEPQSYMFATWVSDQHNVVARYIDVGSEQVVTIAGQNLRAIPIKDRIGIDGSITTHYMSPQGVYLASVNPDSHISIFPTDEQTLSKLYPHADLSRPASPGTPIPTSLSPQ